MIETLPEEEIEEIVNGRDSGTAFMLKSSPSESPSEDKRAAWYHQTTQLNQNFLKQEGCTYPHLSGQCTGKHCNNSPHSKCHEQKSRHIKGHVKVIR
jgi:hypothetical protein